MVKHSVEDTLNSAEHAAEEVSAFARAIVAKRVLATNALAALVALGVIPAAASGTIEHAFQIAATVLGVIGGIHWAQSGVTPAKAELNPVSANGLPLVELTEPVLAPDPEDEGLGGDPALYAPETDTEVSLTES